MIHNLNPEVKQEQTKTTQQRIMKGRTLSGGGLEVVALPTWLDLLGPHPPPHKEISSSDPGGNTDEQVLQQRGTAADEPGLLI